MLVVARLAQQFGIADIAGNPQDGALILDFDQIVPDVLAENPAMRSSSGAARKLKTACSSLVSAKSTSG
jgi:hypothetical protein